MDDTEEPGQPGRSEAGANTTVEAVVCNPPAMDVAGTPAHVGQDFRPMFAVDAALLPADLDERGREAFARLMKEDALHKVIRLSLELERLRVSLNFDGPVTFTADRVQTAYKIMIESDRQKIAGEERAGLNADLAKDLQQASGGPAARAKRARNHWMAGTALTAGTSTAVAAFAGQDLNVWVYLRLVAVNVVGALITRPRM